MVKVLDLPVFPRIEHLLDGVVNNLGKIDSCLESRISGEIGDLIPMSFSPMFKNDRNLNRGAIVHLSMFGFKQMMALSGIGSQQVVAMLEKYSELFPSCSQSIGRLRDRVPERLGAALEAP